MQMNDDALWHLDNNGMELVFCCLNTNARNYARLGQLMLNRGRWNDQQLVPADFVKKMTQPGLVEHYGLSTWLGMHKDPAYFWFSGHLGQHIVVIPEHDMIVVRLGERTEPEADHVKHTAPELVSVGLSLID